MPSIVLGFLLHHPLQLNRIFPYERVKRLAEGSSILDRYFDEKLSSDLFTKASKLCYQPAFRLIREMVESAPQSNPFRFSLMVTGPFLERAVKSEPQLIDQLRWLIKSKALELVGGAYHHSLASLFPRDLSEFCEQITEHRETVRRLFGVEAKTLVNTGLIYNDSIAEAVQRMGFETAVIEGAKSVIEDAGSSYIYTAVGPDGIKLLPRNRELSRYISIYFSRNDWAEYPLTANVFLKALQHAGGDVITLWHDFETLGLRHTYESGIFHFLKELMVSLLRVGAFKLSLPSDAIREHQPRGSLVVPEEGTISWGEPEPDISLWLENSMQKISFQRIIALKSYVREVGDVGITRMWRLLQESSYLRMMATQMHLAEECDSFNPFSSAAEAYMTFNSIFTDFEGRIGTVVQRLRKAKTTQASSPQAGRQQQANATGLLNTQESYRPH